MTLDLSTTAFISQMAMNAVKPLHEMTPEEARLALAPLAMFYGDGPEMAEERDVAAATNDGAEITLRVLKPKGTPRSVIVYYHGGGWVLGNIDDYRSHGRRLAERAGAIVVLVGYRLAPEHAFPTAHNDAWDALKWVDAHMADIAGERLPLIVAGDSAGGNLAAVVAQRSARENGPSISLQVLAYPVTDCDLTRPSYLAPENQLLLNTPVMEWFWNHYAPDAQSRTSPELCPLRAESVAGVAPALLITAEHDILNDEAKAYGDKLRAAGVPVTAKEFEGQMHNFFVMHQVLPAAAASLDWTAEQIGLHLARESQKQSDTDVVIVGAGFSGLYSLVKMRELGLNARVIEAGGDVGGTWYWNRYPGARCDVESMSYSFSFSPELDQEWSWSERYSAQPEILNYAGHVADRFDLRRDMTFNTRVERAVYDEETAHWTVHTDTGEAIRARFVIMATGVLSVVKDIDIEGADGFTGPTYVTGRWPHEGVDFTGLDVAVIGTGSSGVQSIPIIAEQAKKLTVYQRTPAYSTPAKNHPLSEAEIAERKANYPAFREQQRWSQYGFGYDDLQPPQEAALLSTPEQREAKYQAAWESGSLISFGTAYADTSLLMEANDTAAEFIRSKVSEVVKDQSTASKLHVTTYPVFSKRPCIDSGYYEAFNRPNVELVALKETPIERITSDGIRTTAGERKHDAIVYATGFDAVTGALDRIDIQGVGGERLKHKWAEGPRTLLGIAVAGFPNMFTITGPTSPSVFSNMIVSIEQHVDWVTSCIAWMQERDVSAIEPTVEAEDEWVEHVAEFADRTVMKHADSWYYGANVPGKPRVMLAYLGGVNTYRAICDSVAAQGYAGFKTHKVQTAMAAE